MSDGPPSTDLYAWLRMARAIGLAQRAGQSPTVVRAWGAESLDNAKALTVRKGRLAFTAESFILSFSLPNFHFHAVTAYDILRSRGVPIGKRDYEGQLRTSGS